MGVRSLDELDAYRLSVEFRRSVYALVRAHPAADRDFRFRDQLFDAAAGVAAHIAEGFSRRTLREFRQFLSYARSSIAEALTWIEDGVDRGYFSKTSASAPIVLGRRAAGAVAALQRSLKPFLDT
jgi:four helix bundle protein